VEQGRDWHSRFVFAVFAVGARGICKKEKIYKKE